MPKIYGSYKTGADIYKDPKSKKFYILEWNPQTRETYKKFISFKPTESGLVAICRATIKKTRPKKNKTQKKQKGGQSQVPGEMSMDICSDKVLNTESYKSILAHINLSKPEQVATDIQIIKSRYENDFADKRLVDVIYDLPGLGIKPVLGQLTGQMPKMCWDHGIGNPESITGAAPGIHVYIADISMGQTDDPQWQLVGVFNRQ